jgi:hypothetical protein
MVMLELVKKYYSLMKDIESKWIEQLTDTCILLKGQSMLLDFD